MKFPFRSCVLLLVLCGSLAEAGELPAADPRLYADLNWLNNRNVITINLSTWPLSADEIRHAVSHARSQEAADTEVLNRIKQYIDTQETFFIDAHAQSGRPLLPVGMGRTHDQHGMRAGVETGNERFAARVQANVHGGEAFGREKRDLLHGKTVERRTSADLSGSYGGIKIANQWLSIGMQERFWGPGHEGSLILGDSARPFPAVNLQRNVQKPFESKYLSWIGKWNYQVFAGQMLGHPQMRSPRHTKLLGMRVTVSPTDYLDVGASRVIQWGGQGRVQNWKALGHALIGRDNADTAAQRKQEPGNQLAGVDVRVKLQPLTGLPVSAYVQMVGEDEAGLFPSKNFFLAGVDGSHALGTHQTLNWHVEAADTSTKFGRMTGVTYGHHLYRDGYFQQGMPMGHALGGDMRSAVLGVSSALSVPEGKRGLSTRQFGGKLMYAKTLRKKPEDEERFTGAELFWEGGMPVGTDTDWQVGAKGWLVKPEHGKRQGGIGIHTGLRF